MLLIEDKILSTIWEAIFVLVQTQGETNFLNKQKIVCVF